MLAQSTTYKASPVFYSVLGEGDDAGSEVQTKKTRKRRKQLSTDLFGDTRKPRKNQEPLPALTPDQVVFETVRREDAAPDQLITSLPKTTFVRMSPLPADEKDSGQPTASVMEEEEDAYVPTFTIHRAGRVEEQHSSSEELSAKESRKSSASKSKAAPDQLAESSEEAPDLTQNEEPEEDAMVVTREDIQNAGVSESTPFTDYTEEAFDRVMDLNVKGVMIASKVATEYMVEQKSGVILNTSSMVSIYGQPAGVAYPTSKFAVNGMTLSLARELGPMGIRVNAIAPGITETDMMKAVPKEVIAPMVAQIPLRRLGQPEDIANAFVFLASDEASYITGVVLRVDGLARS
jgi:hypothetical protein